MTRRIALAILLTTWIVLITWGSGAFVAVQEMLLDDLDTSLVMRASSLPEVMGVAAPAAADVGEHGVPDGDRYIIKNRLGQTLSRPGTQPSVRRQARVMTKNFSTLADGTRIRTVTIAFDDTSPGRSGSNELIVVYSGSAEHYEQLVGKLWMIFSVVGLSVSLAAAGIAVVVARSALRPLRDAVATVAAIDDNTLDRRLDISSLPKELLPMGERLNEMLARLQSGAQQRKQFMVDAAHELRTPVASLLTTIEVSLRRQRDTLAMTETLRGCLQDVRVLRNLVETLLEQFRVDASAHGSVPREIDVTVLLDSCVETRLSTARQRDVMIYRLYPEGLKFVTQPERLRSIVSNLLSNALEYNQPGGTVNLACTVDETGLDLGLSDSGRGIRSEDLPHVFEPFFRGAEPANQNKEAAHFGLGLYLVKSHVDALGGECTIESELGQGTKFRIRFQHPARAGGALRPALSERETRPASRSQPAGGKLSPTSHIEAV